MGATEVTSQQYQQFDPNHRNGYYDMHYKDQVKPGYLMDFAEVAGHPRFLAPGHGILPVALREDRQESHAAHRSPVGMGLPRRHRHAFFYGDLDTDFCGFANLADATL